jgi:hypothetical protein
VVPGDLPSANATEEELATFAWNEFFALNWKASWVPGDTSKRGKPDTSWSLDSAGTAPSLAVWETYMHRSELRPASGNRKRDLSVGYPDYTFVDSNINAGKDSIDLSNYWNILDENNEIGSTYLFAHKDKTEVLYMAKTNIKEYDYVRNSFMTDAELDKAVDSLSTQSKDDRYSYLKGLTNADMCDTTARSGYVCLPCGTADGEGAIEIKVAFRKLDPLLDDISRFITKEVVVFTPEGTLDSIKASVDTYGLIGLHIIHKTTNYPAFVFASWEQVDARNDNMQTIGIASDTILVNGEKYTDVDPSRLNPVIERVIPETIQAVNKAAKDSIRNQNPNSLWQYYQLIGVQATPIDYEHRNDDNNYFMANYVIESDLMLTNFHGSFGDPFNDSIQNVIFNQKSFNMGGCQGCHGQAQVNFGTDFSFLLDEGNNKPVIKPDLLQTYPEALKEANPGENMSKLKNFISTLSKK